MPAISDSQRLFECEVMIYGDFDSGEQYRGIVSETYPRRKPSEEQGPSAARLEVDRACVS